MEYLNELQQYARIASKRTIDFPQKSVRTSARYWEGFLSALHTLEQLQDAGKPHPATKKLKEIKKYVKDVKEKYPNKYE